MQTHATEADVQNLADIKLGPAGKAAFTRAKREVLPGLCDVNQVDDGLQAFYLGSDGSTIYNITVSGNDDIKCNCPAAMNNAICKHGLALLLWRAKYRRALNPAPQPSNQPPLQPTHPIPNETHSRILPTTITQPLAHEAKGTPTDVLVRAKNRPEKRLRMTSEAMARVTDDQLVEECRRVIQGQTLQVATQRRQPVSMAINNQPSAVPSSNPLEQTGIRQPQSRPPLPAPAVVVEQTQVQQPANVAPVTAPPLPSFSFDTLFGGT